MLHLAPLGAARREPLAALDAETRGTFVLLNAALDAGVPRVILGSSLDLFDRLPAHWDVTERWRPRPAVLQQMSVPLQIAPRNLATAFTRVPNPRRVASVTYPLVAVLSLAVTAILANQRSELAIAQWGARQPAERLRVLGLTTGRAPCQSTLQRLFCKVDGKAVAEALSAHFGPVAVPLPVVAGSQGVAFDGKAQRARYIPMEQPLVDSRSRSTTRVFALYGLVS